MSVTRIERAPFAFVLALLVSGCGARTGLSLPDPVPDAAIDTTPPPECTTTSQCEGFEDKCNPIACVANHCVKQPPVVCDDKDPCTKDTCAPETGLCTYAPATLDVDKDGHRGPLPGHLPGDPGSCGDDCDDTNAAAFPGNKEICDGVDNDCNGVVDDGMHYVPQDPTVDAVRVSGEIAPAGPGGLAFNGTSYLAGYTGSVGGGKYRVFTSLLNPDGSKAGAEDFLTKITADAGGGAMVWNGDTFGVTWNDRRDGSWETYFDRLNGKREKLGADALISDGDGNWSINTAIAWTGLEYALVWQDQRDLTPDFNLYAQRLDVDGKPIGGNVQIQADQSESPSIAIGTGTIGIAWGHTDDAGAHDIWFGIFDRELKPKVPATKVSTKSGVYPTVVWNKTNYVVAWYDSISSVHAVWGASYDESGKALVPARTLTDSPKFSRYPALLPLGDRVLLVWSDTKDGNAGYELYSKMLDATLVTKDPERRITRATGDSVFPVATFGPKGDVGVLFRDDRLGALHVYFTRLVCQAGS